ncbi:unnamed protein product [Closterium sp. NIES-53]
MLAPEEVFAGGEEGVGAGGGRRGSARGMVKGEGEMEREDRKRLRSKLKRKWKGEKAEDQKTSQAAPGTASCVGGAAAGIGGRKIPCSLPPALPSSSCACAGEKAEDQKTSQAVPGTASGVGGAAAGSGGRKIRVVEKGQQKQGLSDFTNSTKVRPSYLPCPALPCHGPSALVCPAFFPAFSPSFPPLFPLFSRLFPLFSHFFPLSSLSWSNLRHLSHFSTHIHNAVSSIWQQEVLSL